jgi:hypothetical protein
VEVTVGTSLAEEAFGRAFARAHNRCQRGGVNMKIKSKIKAGLNPQPEPPG